MPLHDLQSTLESEHRFRVANRGRRSEARGLLSGADPQAESTQRVPRGRISRADWGVSIRSCSTESKRMEVYVQAFPGPGAKVQISNEGGTDPV
jgi:hypothetical protein